MNNHEERVTAVFEAAVLREPAERASFLHEACADDADLRRLVASMLADVDRPVVIDRPIDEAIADLMNDDTPVVAGTEVGPYRVGPLIGAGGMGAVYRARDSKLQRDVALKVLPDGFAADAERVSRFQREARTLAALNHPQIAAIYGLEESTGTPPS